MVHLRIEIILGIAFACPFVIVGGVLSSSDPNSRVEGTASLTDTNDANGPTMIMSYNDEKFVKNPIASFMYFIPLIAPTAVDNISSVNNQQQVAIISYQLKERSKSFRVTCEFEILGSGFHMNTFNPDGMIEAHSDELKKDQTLTNMLDYIRFDGDGYGIIEVKGTSKGSERTVTEVSMQFNAKGHKSPVTIGLYDIQPKDGNYLYENKSNEVVARVNSLIFTKTEGVPHMAIKVASISRPDESEGFWAGLKGAIANMFITPPKVSKHGNDTMMDFGESLLKKMPTFTFPRAKNIKENRILETDTLQK